MLKRILLIIKSWFTEAKKEVTIKNIDSVIAGIESEQDTYAKNAAEECANLLVTLNEMSRQKDELEDKHDKAYRRSKQLFADGRQEDAAPVFKEAETLKMQLDRLNVNIEKARAAYDKILAAHKRHIGDFSNRVNELKVKASVSKMNDQLRQFTDKTVACEGSGVVSQMNDVDKILDKKLDCDDARTNVNDELGLSMNIDEFASEDTSDTIKRMVETFKNEGK